MTGERVLNIRVRTIGQETVQRSLRGITASARQATRIQAQAQAQTTREATQSARARERIAAREATARARLEAQAQRQILQADRRAAREQAQLDRERTQREERSWNERLRMSQRARAAEARAQQQQARAAQRQRDARGRTSERMVAGAGALGVAAVVTMATQTLDAITQRLETITAAVGARAGVQDIGGRTANAQDFELSMARNAGEFFQGVSPEERARQMAMLTDEINNVAVASGQSPTELLGVLETMQQRFSSFELGRRELLAIADEAQRTGADMQTLATMVGTVNQQMGEAAPSAERLFDAMAEMGLQGSVTPESFATNFAPLLGQFAGQTGLHGEDAVRQLAALGNVIAPIAGSDSVAATQLQGLMSAMGDQETRARIAAATGGTRHGSGRSATYSGGLQYMNEDGSIDYMRLVEGLSHVQGAGTTNAIFGRTEARMAVDTLTRAQRHEGTGMSAAELFAVDPSLATARRAEDIARIHGTTGYDSRQTAIQGEVHGIRQLASLAGAANEQLGTREAITQVGGEGLLGMLGAIPGVGTWLQQRVGGAGGALADLSPEQRTMLSGGLHAFGRTGIGAVAGMVGSYGADQLTGIGDRASSLAQERVASRVRLEAGTAVDLTPATVSALGRVVASSMPSALAPSSLGSGGASRTPRDRSPM